MAVVSETEDEIIWAGPAGISVLPKAEYEVNGGTVRLKRRPRPATVPSTPADGVVRGS